MKGPGRGHVNDTTALLWEETVIIYTIMTSERGQKCSLLSVRTNHKTVTIIKITTTNRETKGRLQSAKQTFQQLYTISFRNKDENNCKSVLCPEEKPNYVCACLPHHWRHRKTATLLSLFCTRISRATTCTQTLIS